MRNCDRICHGYCLVCSVILTGQAGATFHETGSLAKMRWDDQGFDTKVLLGHKTEKMSALCADRRGKDWLTVSRPSYPEPSQN